MPQPRLQRTIPYTVATMCDFCSRPANGAALVAFGCRDFERRLITRGDTVLCESCHCHTPIAPQPGDLTVSQNVTGSWLACPGCAAMVLAQDRVGLARAAAVMHRARHGTTLEPPAEVTLVLQQHETGMPLPGDQTFTWERFYYAAHIPFWDHREGGGS